MPERFSDNPPVLPVEVELGGALGGLVERDPELKRVLADRLERELEELLRAAGVPGSVTTELMPNGEPSQEAWLRLRVNGKRCRYSIELMRKVREYVTGRRAEPDVTGSAMLEDFVQGTGAEARQPLADFVALLCRESIKLAPSVLLGAAQVAAYQRALAALDVGESMPGESLSVERLAVILGAVLDLRVSLGDRATVARCLAQGVANGRPDDALVEDLVLALRPKTVEIRLSQSYLRAITHSSGKEEQDSFTMLRDGLFYELGVQFPPFRFVVDDGIKAGSFVVRLNHLDATPWVGIEHDRVLVNDTADRLTLLGISGTRAVNPANGRECATMAADAMDRAHAAGLTTWTPFGYVVLAVAHDLRVSSHCFIDRSTVEGSLNVLRTAFPEPVEYIRTKWPLDLVTRVLRALVREELSIRNLRLILESLADFAHVAVDPASYIVFDPRLSTGLEVDDAWLTDPVNLSAFIRVRSKSQISNKYTFGGNTLVVYLMDSEIERVLARYRQQRRPLPDELHDALLQAIAGQVLTLPFSTSPPVILTTTDVRPTLRGLIASALPRIPVVAYDELSPVLNIQPLGRISLDLDIAAITARDDAPAR